MPVASRLKSFWLSEKDRESPSSSTGCPIQGRTVDIEMFEANETGGCGTARDGLPSLPEEALVTAEAGSGGHCKYPVSNVMRAHAEHGATADQLTTFEERVRGQNTEIFERVDIDCDLHITRPFDLCVTQEKKQT